MAGSESVISKKPGTCEFKQCTVKWGYDKDNQARHLCTVHGDQMDMVIHTMKMVAINLPGGAKTLWTIILGKDAPPVKTRTVLFNHAGQPLIEEVIRASQ